jgi:hypothetical protein
VTRLMMPSWRRRASCRVQGSGRAPGKHWQEVGAAESGDVEARTLQGREQGLFDAAEKVQPLDVTAVNDTWLGPAVEGESLWTLCWSGMDSNFQFRAR